MQIIEYLGLIVNSLLLSLSLRQEKFLEILKFCGDLVKRETTSLREIAKIFGNLAWDIKCIPYAQAHYRALQRCSARKKVGGGEFKMVFRQKGCRRKMIGIDI